MSLRQVDPAAWMAEMLKQREDELYAANKEKVRNILIKHNAEDLIPMLLEDNG
jgi:hypothetical protein